MYVGPMNPNSVHVSVVPNGCCKSAFDTSYPAQLHGVIQANEYQQSVENINKSFKSRKATLIVLAIFIVCLLAGMGLLIGGIATGTSSNTSNLFVFIGVGLGVMVLGMIVMIGGSCILQAREATQLQAAVATESAKYSTRSPTPCSWRLNVTTRRTGYGRNRRVVRVYHLMIDIGRQTGAYGAPASNPYNPYPQPYAAPSQYSFPSARPTYSATPRTGVCGKCGAPRADAMMKFCGSCGQAFS